MNMMTNTQHERASSISPDGNTMPRAPLSRPYASPRVSIEALLTQVSAEAGNPMLQATIDDLLGHLKVMSHRYYLGDVAVVDEFLQLYALDKYRPTDASTTCLHGQHRVSAP